MLFGFSAVGDLKIGQMLGCQFWWIQWLEDQWSIGSFAFNAFGDLKIDQMFFCNCNFDGVGALKIDQLWCSRWLGNRSNVIALILWQQVT